MFHASLCGPLGIRLEDGIEEQLGGIITAARAPIYYHNIKMIVGSEQIKTTAGFSSALSVVGILGRRGFFEKFTVKFDYRELPPILEVERIRHT